MQIKKVDEYLRHAVDEYVEALMYDHPEQLKMLKTNKGLFLAFALWLTSSEVPKK